MSQVRGFDALAVVTLAGLGLAAVHGAWLAAVALAWYAALYVLRA